MNRSRGVVGTLGGFAAAFAFAVGAVSLTRIAGDYLGFPPGLEWTLTASVDVAGIAGGVMWTGFTGAIRKIGCPLNVGCSIVSGVGVGLDHSTHAAPDWQWTAGIAGFLLPALFSLLLHALAVMLDHQAADGERPTVSARDAAPLTPDREAVRSAVSLVVSTSGADREADREVDTVRSVRSRPSAAVRAVPTTVRQAVNRDPDLPDLPGWRADWMTPALVWAVVSSMRDAGHPTPRYGEGRVIKEHRLPDGDKIGPSKARTLLRYIDDHDLLRVAS